MTDTDLNDLLNLPLDRSLDGLEEQIWAGVARLERSERSCRLAVSLQACVLAIAIGAGGLVGANAAHSRQGAAANPLALGERHTPSHLLLGIPQ